MVDWRRRSRIDASVRRPLLWSAVRAVEVSVAGMGAGLLRLMLLAVLSVGVIGMHTIGHSGDHGSWETSGHEAGAAMPGTAAWLADAMDLCDGDCAPATPVAARPGPGSDPVPGGTGFVVMCLAVLAGLGVVALLASFLARTHRSVVGTTGPPPTRSPRAGPAPAFMFAARLVDVAVLRI
jgi:hypothetical protein